MSNYPPWTQSESTSEVSPAKSYPVVLEKLPVEQEEKISRYFESFVGQSEQDEVLNEPTRADSDSADSLFITQKPVPAPVRAARSLCRKRSDPKPLRSLIESEDDTSSSSSSSPSEEEPKSDHKRRKKKYKLPECSFPFIKERNCKFRIANITLHNSVMGGFFKCVRQIWQGQQAGEDMASVLPTVDTDGSLSPLSEEEGEGEGNEDIKVVEKKLFARPLKTKSHQTCCTQLKEIKRRKAANAGKETSQEIQQEMQTEATRSKIRPELEDSDSCDDGETAEAEKKEINEVERVRTNGHQSIEEEEPYNKRSEEEESTVAEPRADQPSPKAQTQSQQDVLSNPHTESVGSETWEKKKRRKRKDKEVEESDGAASVNVEVNEIPGHSSDIRAEPSMSQASDELEMKGNDLMLSNDENAFRQVERDTPDLKQRKKKKNKVKEQEKPDVAASGNVEVDDIPSQSLDNGAVPLTSQTRDGLQEDVNQEVDGNLERDVREEDLTFLSSCNMETGRKEKKKKRKRKEDEENLDEEQMESSANFETDAKKKRESVAENLNQEVDENLERDLGEEDAALLSSCHVERVGKKKTKKKRGKEDEENVDMDHTESIADVEPNAKKENKDPEEKEKVDNMHQTEEDLDSQNADLVTKKKKKRRKRDRDNSEVKEAQIDDSVSVSEKEERRTSSFLDADADSLLSVEARSQDAEWVPAGDFEAESVEIANNFEKYRKKQKKNKRKMEKDHEDLGEASATCLSGLPEGADTKVKRKRKQTGSESEMVTPEERSQIVEEAGRINEDLVPRKKEKKKTEEPRDVLQQTLLALNTCNSTSHMDKNTSAPLETCESTDMRGKKKKKKVKNADGIQLEGESATNLTDFGPQFNKDEKRNKQSGGLPSSPVFLKTSLSMSEVSSSDTITKKKRPKVKKELLNPNEELLTDF